MKSKGKIQLFFCIHSLLLDTFRYTQDKILNTIKCENRSCRGCAIQIWFKSIKHEETTWKCKVKANLKRRIEDSPQPTKRIYRKQQLISFIYNVTANYIK